MNSFERAMIGMGTLFLLLLFGTFFYGLHNGHEARMAGCEPNQATEE